MFFGICSLPMWLSKRSHPRRVSSLSSPTYNNVNKSFMEDTTHQIFWNTLYILLEIIHYLSWASCCLYLAKTSGDKYTRWELVTGVQSLLLTTGRMASMLETRPMNKMALNMVELKVLPIQLSLWALWMLTKIFLCCSENMYGHGQNYYLGRSMYN